jgi:hypothetical protein
MIHRIMLPPRRQTQMVRRRSRRGPLPILGATLLI